MKEEDLGFMEQKTFPDAAAQVLPSVVSLPDRTGCDADGRREGSSKSVQGVVLGNDLGSTGDGCGEDSSGGFATRCSSMPFDSRNAASEDDGGDTESDTVA